MSFLRKLGRITAGLVSGLIQAVVLPVAFLIAGPINHMREVRSVTDPLLFLLISPLILVSGLAQGVMLAFVAATVAPILALVFCGLSAVAAYKNGILAGIMEPYSFFCGIPHAPRRNPVNPPHAFNPPAPVTARAQNEKLKKQLTELPVVLPLPLQADELEAYRKHLNGLANLEERQHKLAELDRYHAEMLETCMLSNKALTDPVTVEGIHPQGEGRAPVIQRQTYDYQSLVGYIDYCSGKNELVKDPLSQKPLTNVDQFSFLRTRTQFLMNFIESVRSVLANLLSRPVRQPSSPSMNSSSSLFQPGAPVIEGREEQEPLYHSRAEGEPGESPEPVRSGLGAYV